MSDDPDPETPDPDAEGGESAEERASGDDEQPEIEPDEQADMGELAEIAEQVEDEAGASTDTDDADDEPDLADDEEPAEPDEGPDWGDLYVGTVTTGLNAVIEEYGDEDAEPVDEALAYDLHLDEYVNEWMADQGKAEMDPAQGMILATLALTVTVLVSKTDLPNQALTKAKSSS